ncbi:hypothetical protein [Microvirga subterranea]|uniref:Lipoprotein n=1 Tax=Microvirga subterranea TaxID=186651 RepID=A0A370HDM9_9HYPH|nr:hypothetical protein [Microvirga subterranea]RDI55165.1 hypothetical protein DES45_110112 [Microvirga subterranea]
MSGELRRNARRTFALLGLTVLAGCGAPGEGGSTVGNMLAFAGPTVPPPVKQQVEDVYCPQVEIADGGSTMRSYAGGRVGDAAGLRSQVSISDLARECVGQPDGTVLVKVGVEGRALLGAGGGGGRFDVPVKIVVKRGDKVIANRLRRTAVSIPAGQAGANFAVVEEGIVVPAADASTFDIEVALAGR